MSKPRHPHDLYVTEYAATVAFWHAERDAVAAHAGGNAFGRTIWEPFYGRGHIARALEIAGAGFRVVGTDLIDYSAGVQEHGIDFFRQSVARAAILISNPPYKDARRVVAHAFRLGIRYVALMLSATFFHSGAGARLYAQYPPQRHYPISWRLDFTGQKNNNSCHSWWVWDTRTACARGTMPPLVKPAWLEGMA